MREAHVPGMSAAGLGIDLLRGAFAGYRGGAAASSPAVFSGAWRVRGVSLYGARDISLHGAGGVSIQRPGGFSVYRRA
jgi:hypothetical protein